ncbi:hypothetical protein V1478_017709 [Vespula squamosa]|uniref:Uncharacterized protein n=1 Tax=Vespula squamosa TaxID=30214 RepID=A0ABD1ZWL2_VESSQ
MHTCLQNKRNRNKIILTNNSQILSLRGCCFWRLKFLMLKISLTFILDILLTIFIDILMSTRKNIILTVQVTTLVSFRILKTKHRNILFPYGYI